MSSSGPDDFTEILSRVLAPLEEIPALVDELKRTRELQAAAVCAEPEPLPRGVRSGLRELIAVLAFSPSPEEVLRIGRRIDLRDFNEQEIAHLERVSVKTVQRWRVEGIGPLYRNQGSIRYPVKDYFTWCSSGRQRMTSQRTTRGRRS